MKIILGIDPGYARLGWGVVQTDGVNVTCLGFGCIETPKEEELATRLANLNDELLKIINEFRPNDIAIEELFFAKNVKTALNVAHARGIILMRASYHCGRIFQYRPNVIKLAVTGANKADKKQVQAAVQLILRLPDRIKPDDAADGLAIALTHADALAMGQ